MLPQVTDEQLGEAVLQSAKDGLYPDSEEVISANIPATALPVLLQYLNDAREEVKVRTHLNQLFGCDLRKPLQSDIRERSRGTAPDIDGWISQAKQLQADIEESRASARQIVRQSEAEKSLEGQVNDASSKVDLLKGEVFFNETLAETLEQIERIHQLLYSVQEATLGDRLLDAIVWLEKAQEEIGMLRTFENTRVVKILRGKATDIHGAIVETIDDCWKALLRMDTSTGRVTIKHEIQSKIIPVLHGLETNYTVGATLVDVHAIVMALTKLGLLKTKINELYHGFDKVILAPRMVLGPDNNVAAISVIGDDIQVTGRLPDTDVKHLFEDIETMIDYLSTRLPPSIAVPLSELLMPGLVSQLISKWLLPSVPSSLDGMQDFQEMLALVLQLADVVDSVGWRGKEDLHDWVEQAPRVWLTKRRETSLDTVRALLSKGVGNSRMVERVETQTVSPEDKMFQGPGGGGEGDDWNAGWSEDEDKSNVTSTSTQGEKEGDFSAWDLEKTTDDGEIESKTTNAQDNANDDLDEGWGWGDDDEDQESSAPPSRTKTKKSTSTNKRHVQGPPDSSKREVTLKEKYSITALPAAVLEIIEQVVSDAEILAQPK